MTSLSMGRKTQPTNQIFKPRATQADSYTLWAIIVLLHSFCVFRRRWWPWVQPGYPAAPWHHSADWRAVSSRRVLRPHPTHLCRWRWWIICLLRKQRLMSRVHIRISKPIPIRITLIRVTFHGMTSYFKHE